MIDEKKIKKNFGSVVKKLRMSKSLTQEQLAERLDLQMQTITSIETGRSFISCEVLAKLCNYFNVEPSYLFSLNHIDLSENNLNYIKEINRVLKGFNSEKLEEIFNILLALKK